MVQPGQADDTVSIALGYGRDRAAASAGRRAINAGLHSDRRMTSGTAGGFRWRQTGKARRCSMQEHDTHGTTGADGHRTAGPILRESDGRASTRRIPRSVEEMRRFPSFDSIYPELSYDKGNQWGMAIDLNACTGCNACVVACQAENNIPVVGKEQVLRGREMHWIRLDRYYRRRPRKIRRRSSSRGLQQCENAPCENGLPGGGDGAQSGRPERHGVQPLRRHPVLRQQLPLQGAALQLPQLPQGRSPEIDEDGASTRTSRVRMRGVMEKCTYCVQRIQEAKIEAKAERPPARSRTARFMTACQQTCPADAIVFGNINDPESRVSQAEEAAPRLRAARGTRTSSRARRTWRSCAIPIRSWQ